MNSQQALAALHDLDDTRAPTLTDDTLIAQRDDARRRGEPFSRDNTHELRASTTTSSRRSRLAAVLAVAAVLVIGLTVAVTAVVTNHRGAAPASDPSPKSTAGEDACTNPAWWASVGQRLADLDAQVNLTGPLEVHPLQTTPVDITEPGTIRLIAGPLPDGYDPSVDPPTVSIPETVEDCVTFTWVSYLPTSTTIGGERYIQYTLDVTEVDTPYRRLTAWLH